MKEEFGTYETDLIADAVVEMLTDMGEVAWNEGCTVYVDYEEADRRREKAGKENADVK